MKPGGGGGVRFERPLAVDRNGLSRLLLSGLLCAVGFLVGSRFSHEAFVTIFFVGEPESFLLGRSKEAEPDVSLRFPYILDLKVSNNSSSLFPPPFPFPLPTEKSSRVHVGRHEILIRPWPHPNPSETMLAHTLIRLLQKKQRENLPMKPLIIVTPTYSRTFQAFHLTGLIHILRSLQPAPLAWIVVEDGRKTEETSALLSKSGLPFSHLGFPHAIPSSPELRMRTESKMRIVGLRFIREQRLDGIIVFADDSNIHSLEFFDEALKVKWIGALSVGILSQSNSQELTQMEHESRQLVIKAEAGKGMGFPLQGPACNSSGHLIGWHASNQLNSKVDKIGTHAPKRLEWAGFVLNAQVLFNDLDKPSWIRDWHDWADYAENPLDMLKDEAFVEPLGHCGQDILLWWLRVEARADSKFPTSWVINEPLEIVVPSKHTPWPAYPLVNYSRSPDTPRMVNGTMVNHREKHKLRSSFKVGGGLKGKRSSRHSDRRRRQTVTKEDNKLEEGGSYIASDATMP